MDRQILRLLPRVDTLTEYVKKAQEAESLPYHIIVECSREVLERLRAGIIEGKVTNIPDIQDVSKQVLQAAFLANSYSLKTVINATGVVLHTNLGRAVLSEKAAENVKKIAMSYSNLEFDTENGERGSRHTHIESLICKVTGAEAAMAVNNNAAAVMLTLMSLCNGKEVIVSRGELVEIGGSFRVPEIMALSGAVLKEVGTTNKTKLKDYRSVFCEGTTAAFLKVHTSNFKIIGFCEDVGISELAGLGKELKVPVIYDLGSGLMAEDNLLNDETTVKECIKQGADIVCFSGDKLLGGPQAGIIAGAKKYIDAMKSNQLARAFRIDKLSLAALEATLKAYLDSDTAKKEIPVLASIAATPEELKNKANKLCKMLSSGQKAFKAAVKKSEGQVGGGCAPDKILPSYVLEITADSKSAEEIEKELRLFETPIITRINKGAVLIDVRTVRESEFKTIANAFKKLFSFAEGEQKYTERELLNNRKTNGRRP